MKIAVIAGETSGDSLGAGLMKALPLATFIGIGGDKMQSAGLTSLFPMQELTVMGFTEVIMNLPRLLKRINETVNFIINEKPDVAVFIDAQDFCDRVARKVRAKAPNIRLVKYVAPTVWAWRPGRAAKLKPIYDEVLALFPFEPAVMQSLNGPPTTYIGHPLINIIAPHLENEKPYALLLPGSRFREIKYMLPIFGEAIAAFPQYNWVLPTLPHLKTHIENQTVNWSVKPQIILNNKEIFTQSHIALATSGTVTLELALHGVPMIAAYKGGAIEAAILKRLVKTTSILLPNIILNENIIPEFIQENLTAEKLIHALSHIESDKQKEAFIRLRGVMSVEGSPDENAAKRIIAMSR
jgi:lipid-A-disaccharide synthase